MARGNEKGRPSGESRAAKLYLACLVKMLRCTHETAGTSRD